MGLSNAVFPPTREQQADKYRAVKAYSASSRGLKSKLALFMQ
jgi:hypothetical protein